MLENSKSNVVDLSGRRGEAKEQVLERLFREHGAALRAFLRMRRVGNEELEDIVQDVFVRLARMNDLRERLPPGEQRNRAFLFTVANNLLVDQRRHQRLQRQYLQEQAAMSDETENTGESPELAALAREQLDHLRGVIMNLHPKWRESFILTRFMHKSYRQAADEMGVSVRQIERYVTKALVKIRKAAADIKGRV